MEKVNNKFLACAEKLMKKIFLNCSLPKRLWFGVVLIGFALTLALPLHTANAQVNVQDLVLSNVPVVSTFWQAWKGVQWVGDVAGPAVSALPSQIAEAIFSTLFKILLAIGAMSVGAASSILKGVLSPNFISWSYTNPATNPLIYEGWGLTRDFANMFLVVVLVFIGLGTALRIGEYEARKTLPLLIGIALLINFTPVICGIIVDAANIIMNFFLSNIGGLDVLLKIIKVQNDTVDQMFKTGGIEAFFGTVLLFIFDIITSIVLLLFAFLFFLRYIAIWMLVILSPIAFVCYILPATRGVFKNWWNQFIQWSFIGVVAAFFIHLGNFLMARTAEVISSPSPNEFPASLIQSILAPLVALLFLLIGFFASLSTSAMGASGAINFAQRQTKALPGRLGKTKIAGKASGAAAAGLAAGARGVQRLEQAISKVNLPGVGKSLQVATKPLTWSTRKALTAPVPTLLKHSASTRKTSVPASFDQMSPGEQERYVDIQGSSEDRTVLGARMADKDALKFTSPEFQKRVIEDAEKMAGNNFYKKEVAGIMNALPDKITAKMKIDFAITPDDKKKMNEDIKNLKKELGLADENEAARVIHIRTALKPNDIANISKGSLKSEIFQLGSQGFSPSHLTKIRDSFDAETVGEFFEGKKGLNTVVKDRASLEDFYRKNPRLVKWFATSPAGREWDWKGNDIIRQEFGPYEAFRRHMASTTPPPAGGTTQGGTPPPGGNTPPPTGTPPGGTPPPGGPRGRPGPGTGTPKGTTPTPRGRPGATGSTRQEWEQWSEALRDINRKTTQPPPASSSPGGTPPPSSSGNWGGWPEWGASGGTPPPTSPPSSPPPPRGKTGPRGAKKTP